MKKKAKTGQKSLEVVVEIPTANRDDPRRILRCLMDSGSSESIILDDFLGGFKKQNSKIPQRWKTKGGNFSTTTPCVVPFYIEDFSTQKRVTWNFHVDNQTTSSKSGYDMIIGHDLLDKLGIDIKFSSGTLKWDDTEVPMRDF